MTQRSRSSTWWTLGASLICLLPAGCQPGDRGKKMDSGIQHPESDADAPGELVTREQKYESGALFSTQTGYTDENGEFVPHGLLNNLWESGQKKSEMNFFHGLRHGMKRAWYQSGQLWSEGEYIHGKEQGVWTVWFPDGRKAQEITFDNGGFHGPYREWHTNGKQKVEFTYVRGKKEGLMRIWDEQGDLKEETTYVNDVRQP